MMSVSANLGDHLPFCLARPPTGGTNIQTVKNFDLNKYYGVWFEQVRSLSFISYKSKCCTAEYHDLKNGTSSVQNACPSGEGIKAVGTPENGDPARLSVDFDIPFKFAVPFAKGNYYVLYVEEGETQYELSVVGEPCRLLLWVLTREENPDPAKVQRALKVAQDQGFNTDKAVYRDSDCKAQREMSE